MSVEDETKMGDKGEILFKKKIRETTGIYPGDHILVTAQRGEILIKKVYSVEELLEMPIIDTGTAQKHEQDIEAEVDRQLDSNTDDN